MLHIVSAYMSPKLLFTQLNTLHVRLFPTKDIHTWAVNPDARSTCKQLHPVCIFTLFGPALIVSLDIDIGDVMSLAIDMQASN